MKATELRIGNYVMASTYMKIDAKFIYEYSIVGGDYKPIPLTEDILLKCGFVQCLPDETYYTVNPNDFHIRIEKNELKNNENVLWVYFDEQEDHPITCIFELHQLQNLYFALTETELTIKL